MIEDLKVLTELLREQLTRFQQVSQNKDHRVVVFIDDLDRCSPSKIVKV